jgi:hypothetical protein
VEILRWETPDHSIHNESSTPTAQRTCDRLPNGTVPCHVMSAILRISQLQSSALTAACCTLHALPSDGTVVVIIYICLKNRSHTLNLKALICAMEKSIQKKLSLVPLPVPCPGFPKTKFLRLFARMRIYYTLKFHNRNLKQRAVASKKHRKLSKIQHV